MQYEQLGDRYIVRLDEGEEALATLRSFLVEHDILAGYLMAWGAFSRLSLRYSGFAAGRYEPRTLDLEGRFDVASLLANIAILGGEPVLHAHVTVADEAFRTYSGHLAAGTVGPTLEVIVNPLPRALHRFWDPDHAVARLDPEEAPEEAERLEAWP